VSAIQLPDGRYRVTAPGFTCGVAIVDGRVSPTLTAPELRRLGGMMADAFACYARSKKWKVDAVQEGEVKP
jgi:hypothetical protein